MSPSWCASIYNEVSLIHVSNGYHCKIEFTKFKLGDPKNLLLQWLLSSTLNLVGDLKHFSLVALKYWDSRGCNCNMLLSGWESKELCTSIELPSSWFGSCNGLPSTLLALALGWSLGLHLHWVALKLVCTCICCSHTDQSGPVSLPLSLMQGRQCLTALPFHALHLGIEHLTNCLLVTIPLLQHHLKTACAHYSTAKPKRGPKAIIVQSLHCSATVTYAGSSLLVTSCMHSLQGSLLTKHWAFIFQNCSHTSFHCNALQGSVFLLHQLFAQCIFIAPNATVPYAEWLQ